VPRSRCRSLPLPASRWRGAHRRHRASSLS
jgi:hypothetical protein